MQRGLSAIAEHLVFILREKNAKILQKKNAPKRSTITHDRGVPEVSVHKLGN